MNRLIERLAGDGELSVDALKRLYRMLALQSHPDLTGKADAEFIRLQREYEDALDYLRSLPAGPRARTARADAAVGDPREACLKELYLYSIRYSARRWKSVFPALIAAAERYRPDAARALREYRRSFLERLSEWEGSPFVTHTHEMFLTAIKQLATYYEVDLPQNERILSSCLRELTNRARRPDLPLRSWLPSLCAWLAEELRGARLNIRDL